MTKAQELLHFDHEYNPATQFYLPAKCIVKALYNSLFHILVANMLGQPQKVKKRKILGRFDKERYTIINNES